MIRFVLSVLTMVIVVGCGNNQLAPDVTEAEFKAAMAEEKKTERKLLTDLESKLGSDHPQVKQMKMELGDTPMPEGPEAK